MNYDPRSIASKVYNNLQQLHDRTPSESDRKEQKTQAVEIYSYLSAWGLLRLKAEEFSLQNQPQKQKVIRCFFRTFAEIVSPDAPQQFQEREGLQNLANVNRLSASEYLGLTGVALQLGREFAFWAEAVYPKDAPASTTPARP